MLQFLRFPVSISTSRHERNEWSVGTVEDERLSAGL